MILNILRLGAIRRKIFEGLLEVEQAAGPFVFFLKINTKINFAVAQIDTLKSPDPSTIFRDIENTCAIELHRANGMILKISSLPIPSLQTIISQFME